MEDKYIGKIMSSYEVMEKTAQQDTSHHFLYKCRCIYCGTIELRSPRNLVDLGRRCIHFDKFGYPSLSNDTIYSKRLKQTFKGMKARCYDIDDKCYKWYGGKGVKICDEWLYNPIAFLEWAMANGYQDNLTIDRIDSSKDYCPENCQWITKSENSRKASKANYLTINDKTLTGRQWAMEIKKGKNFVNRYLKQYGKQKTIEIIKSYIER